MAGSDRPLRRMAEAWIEVAPQLKPEAPRIANFYSQEIGYLLNGWVEQGFVLDILLKRNPDVLDLQQAGPVYSDAFQMLRFFDAPHPQRAQEFYSFFLTEKTQRLLGEYKIIH